MNTEMKLNVAQNSLKDLLKAKNNHHREMMPKELLEIIERATKDLSEFSFKENTLQVGDTFPEGILLNSRAEEVSLKEALDGKPAIISFYRGGWCPYCNLELAYYNELLGEEENKNVRMFAISPEKPDLTTDTKELNFTVCSDIDNKLAKELNLVFKLPKDIQEIYTKFGIDVDASQGNTNKELPVPVTFVIDKDGKVTYVGIDDDYSLRAEAKDVVAEFNKLV